MKFRTVVCALVLGFCVQLLPGAFGQTEPNPPSGAPQTTQQPASQQPQASAPAAQSQPAPAPQQKQPKVKPGSKDDVNAIGDRGMGGKGLGNWYSIEKEVAMGKQYAAMVESSVKMVNDPVVSEYVNRVGQNLVRNSDAKVPFTIKVVDSDEVNAFALPGGFFYVNSGLVLAADEEAELAGVMSHEIAHVAARHATRQMTRGNMVNLASIPLIFVGGGLGYAIRSAAGLGLPLTFLRFSRGFEEEADFLGLQYMYKSGYDPQAYVTFFEKLQAKEKKKPGTLSKAFSTHPQTPDRIKRTQQEIARILPARDQYVISTSEFDTVKARLAAIENRRKTIGPAKENQPSLRRSKKTDKADTSGEGDRPTLQRRDDRQKQ
ncbi:MAG TPA: M48 family metallopeptidase [Terriglobales bacterium]|jgi:predicted Zn-dependent protease|nr:M48 family metallopeptidase [Terriglobales bacterium]